ncbi:hypothetical protein C8J57DRAFT_1247536 [Mycena rebaudengoi]|nr:hypothetical protein C8J57DRAFT_1247536 [Mycena rebaudengoi]
MSKLKTVPEDLLGGHQEGSAVDNFVGEHPAPVDLSHSGGEFSAALHKELRKEKAKLGQSIFQTVLTWTTTEIIWAWVTRNVIKIYILIFKLSHKEIVVSQIYLSPRRYGSCQSISGGSRTWDGGGRQDTGVVCTWHAKLTVDPVRNAEHTHPVSGTDIRTGAEEVAQGKKEA